jgi:L-ascorbate metabolism protein UlaG (beta-lactamase superfamily)
MILTKYKHACFTVEHNGEMIVVDPGDFTDDYTPTDNVVAVVITHEHGDHFDKKQLQMIAAKNPAVTIVAHESITSQLNNLNTQSVVANEGLKIKKFELEFFGGEHAVIHPDIPIIPNLGVLINNSVFYPGDSFVKPDRHIEILALPVGAPWLKLSETIDYVTSVKPKLAFPTHDAVLSDIGKALPDNRIPSFAEKYGTKYQRLIEPLDIK